jgi:hypothetical protein
VERKENLLQRLQNGDTVDYSGFDIGDLEGESDSEFDGPLHALPKRVTVDEG